MGFLPFLVDLIKLLSGYAVGILMLIVGVLVMNESFVIGGIIVVLGFVVFIYGIYMERRMKAPQEPNYKY